MYENFRRRKVRSETPGLDILHIIIGIAVVVMAVFCFMNPLEYLFFFPVIFLLAAILNVVSGRYRYHNAKDRGQSAMAVVQTIFGGALFILGVISAVSIWWR